VFSLLDRDITLPVTRDGSSIEVDASVGLRDVAVVIERRAASIDRLILSVTRGGVDTSLLAEMSVDIVLSDDDSVVEIASVCIDSSRADVIISMSESSVSVAVD